MDTPRSAPNSDRLPLSTLTGNRSGFPDRKRQHTASLRTTCTCTRVWHKIRSTFSEMSQPQYISPVDSWQGPPQHYQAPQRYVGSPNSYAQVQPPARKRGHAHSGSRGLRYTGRKKALCVRVPGNSRSYPYAKPDADQSRARLGRN